MDDLLKLLKKNALESPANIADELGLTEDEVKSRILEYENQGVIRGYQAIINEDVAGPGQVKAVIEVKVTPEREGGFNRIAARISGFEQIDSLYLMSGTYDLLVLISGDDLKEVAQFVSEKLATMEGVISTATHFMLKTYKQRGVLMEEHDDGERLKITP